ncbi:Ionotropic receptor 188 [Hyalella azteca]|uniref:Ionotropic receptor 188 n=1 Tax=Hyalella azteca TaxID=294128 RepID=A0A6A0GY48_HYAAZ|nr:Ionotropic receptor 188 [Hyalella azteca]
MALSGHVLRVAADTWLPYVSFPVEAEADPSLLSGAAFEIFRIITTKLNVSFKLVRSVDGYWGSPVGNGSFNGMVGQVLRGEVDMALGPFIQTHERQQVADFSEVLITDSFGIFLPRPGIEKNLANFLKPLSVETWILFFISAVASFLFGTFLRNSEKKFNGQEDSSVVLTNLIGLITFETTIVQAKECERVVRSGKRPKYNMIQLGRTTWKCENLSGRLLLGVWLFASLVLSTVYCGSLTSQLAVPVVRVPVDSLEDLVKSNMQFATEANSAIDQMLTAATSGVMKEIADRMSRVSSCYYSRFDIKSGKLAVLCDFISMKKVTSEEFSTNATCSYYIARERMSGGSLSFLFPKKSFYKPLFDHQ